MKTAIYPGSFDPITKGHLDVLHTGCEIFDKVIIAVAKNSEKKGFLTVEERVALIRETIKDLPNAEVDCFEGLTIEYAKRQDKEIIVISPRTNKIITKADIDIMVNDYFKAQPHASKLYRNSYRMFLNFIYKLNFSGD